MAKADQECRNCYYVGRPMRANAGYICRRNPPILQWIVVPIQENILDPNSVKLTPTPCGGWPTTEPNLWCGEWRPEGSQ